MKYPTLFGEYGPEVCWETVYSLNPQPGLIKPMGENGHPFSAYGFRSIFLIGGIYPPLTPERAGKGFYHEREFQVRQDGWEG